MFDRLSPPIQTALVISVVWLLAVGIGWVASLLGWSEQISTLTFQISFVVLLACVAIGLHNS